MAGVPQIVRREIEAEQYLRFYQVLREELGEQKALELIGRVSAGAAFEQGRALAATSDEPSLAHFATIMETWKAGGALDFKDVSLQENTWSFTVTRCGYAELYSRMGLPPELAYAVSCLRDEHLARGYGEHLRLERSGTIVEGRPCCEFRFIWER